jgi:hypothetical protein
VNTLAKNLVVFALNITFRGYSRKCKNSEKTHLKYSQGQRPYGDQIGEERSQVVVLLLFLVEVSFYFIFF